MAMMPVASDRMSMAMASAATPMTRAMRLVRLELDVDMLVPFLGRGAHGPPVVAHPIHEA